MPLAGIFLALSILSTLGAEFFAMPVAIPGTLQALTGLLLWRRTPYGVKRASVVLLIVGTTALMIAPPQFSFFDVISKNQQLIAMLAAVGLLRYAPQPEAVERSPQGQFAMWQTLFGLHWLSSVINLSALVIFSDRLSDSKQQLTPFQGKLLSRGFSLASFWSPFFVGTGLALTYAPGANYLVLLLWGLSFSHALMAAMIWRISRTNPAAVAAFQGYSFKPASLAAPACLAAGVILLHYLFSDLAIPTIITLLSPCYFLLANRKNKPVKLLNRFVFDDLPRMGPEIVLFVSSGILGCGLSSLVAGRFSYLITEFSPLLLICAGLALILGLASVGIHPVVGVTVVGGIFSTVSLPPDLLGLSFLIAWGLGVLVNPISGVHLLLSGRYAYPNDKVWSLNFIFVGISYCSACCLFWLYLQFAG